METEEVNKIYETRNYDLFKSIPGNRDITENEGHVLRLMDSFKEKYLFTVVCVNKKMQVIDGQNRIEAAKRLNLPIRYMILPNGYSLREVQRYNTNTKTWTKMAYLKSFCKIGSEPYLRFKEFMDNYPEFGIAAAQSILCNTSHGWQGVREQGGKVRYRKTKPFEDGKLVIDDLPLAYENAGKITQYKEFYNGYTRVSFVRAMLSLFQNKKFDHGVMLRKLGLQPSTLVHCATIEQYKNLIETVYNYKSQNKVSLKY